MVVIFFSYSPFLSSLWNLRYISHLCVFLFLRLFSRSHRFFPLGVFIYLSLEVWAAFTEHSFVFQYQSELIRPLHLSLNLPRIFTSYPPVFINISTHNNYNTRTYKQVNKRTTKKKVKRISKHINQILTFASHL